MAVIKLILTALDVSGCRIFASGERFTVDYPQIVLADSDKACITAMAQLHPYIFPLSRGVAFATLQTGEDTATLRCCCSQGSVLFKVEKKFRRLLVSGEVQKHLDRLKLDIARLQAVPIFSPLPGPSLEKIIPFLQLCPVETGTDIIRQGDVGQSLFIIITGEVLVVREGGQPGEEVLATLTEGECFGEMSLISGEPVSATIRANSPTTLLVLSKEDFAPLLLDNPSLNLYFTKLLTQRLQQTNSRIMDMLDRGIQGNVKTFSIPELIQTLALNRRTGALVIMDKHAKAPSQRSQSTTSKVKRPSIGFWSGRRDSSNFSLGKSFPPPARSPRIPCNSSWKGYAAWTKTEAAFLRGSLVPRRDEPLKALQPFA
jgi:CRP/FNR family cyclic AMP-dependent transcriptional regulator